MSPCLSSIVRCNDFGTDLYAVGDVRIVASLLEAGGIIIAIGYWHLDRLSIGEDNRHLFGSLAFRQPDGGCNGCCSGTGARGQSAMQGIELWQQFLYHPPQAIRAVDH